MSLLYHHRLIELGLSKDHTKAVMNRMYKAKLPFTRKVIRGTPLMTDTICWDMDDAVKHLRSMSSCPAVDALVGALNNEA